MRFRSRALDLMIPRESEDIVQQNVRLAIMLMKTAVRCSIHQIALIQDAAAAFIVVNSPTAVAPTGHIVPQVVDNACAGLFAQRIDPAHVAQGWSVTIGLYSDMMNMIELDQVVARQGRSITPRP